MKKLLLLFFISPLLCDAQYISTVVGTGVEAYGGDGGMAATAEIYKPDAIAFDRSGNMFFTDCYNYRIRKVSPAGIISTVAGNGSGGHSGDGGAATLAQIGLPDGIAVDSAGDLYISESDSYIRKVNGDGIISTIAGTGTFGYNGDGIPATAAQVAYPYMGFVDDSGNVYFGDYDNHRVRKISNNGIITTVAGNGTNGYSGDGGLAIRAEVGTPAYVSKGPAGDIYFSDNTHGCVRKINSLEVISTFAGTGSRGNSGDGGPATNATFTLLNSINFDNAGNAYIADYGANVIRRVDSSGIIETIAGTGIEGYAGDGGPATDAEFYGPNYVICDASDNVFIADLNNSRIRRITYHPEAVPNTTRQVMICAVYPNPAVDQITVTSPDRIGNIVIINMVGQVVYSQAYKGNTAITLSVKDCVPGVYFVRVNGGSVAKFVKD